MFEGLTTEQMTSIRTLAAKIKEKTLYHSQFLYDMPSIIKITSYRCMTELKKKNINITKDVELATIIFSAFPMSDIEFEKIKETYNCDFELIGKQYGVNTQYVRVRDRLALIRKQKLIENIRNNSKNNNNSESMSKKLLNTK